MIVSTINVNGIRAAIKQRSPENLGLLPWLANTTADVVCLQETRADDDQLAAALAPALADGWHLSSAEPHIKGRSGVAMLSPSSDRRRSGRSILTKFGSHGRYLEADTAGLTVASVYIQTGEAGTDRQLEKERFMAALACADGRAERLRPRCRRLRRLERRTHRGRHQELERQRQEVGVPAQRTAMALRSVGVGLGRRGPRAAPDVAGPYSWWSWRGRAFDNDAGWRIDYQLATAGLAERANAARVERAAAYALRWSDHSPVTVAYR